MLLKTTCVCSCILSECNFDNARHAHVSMPPDTLSQQAHANSARRLGHAGRQAAGPLARGRCARARRALGPHRAPTLQGVGDGVVQQAPFHSSNKPTAYAGWTVPAAGLSGAAREGAARALRPSQGPKKGIGLTGRRRRGW